MKDMRCMEVVKLGFRHSDKNICNKIMPIWQTSLCLWYNSKSFLYYGPLLLLSFCLDPICWWENTRNFGRSGCIFLLVISSRYLLGRGMMGLNKNFFFFSFFVGIPISTRNKEEKTTFHGLGLECKWDILLWLIEQLCRRKEKLSRWLSICLLYMLLNLFSCEYSQLLGF